MGENSKWLEQNGYEYDDVLQRYWFKYTDGDYMAVIGWELSEALTMPLLHLKIIHDKFMERAKNKEIF